MWPAFGLHDTRARINFPHGNGAVQEFIIIDPRMVSHCEVLVMRIFEQIKEGLGNEDYTADL
ncbi:hypothetical protein TRIUR3_19880 [Triticum urartu]|uniref:Uncharacterized protein n=1 Tax=Triticum urartu TaxID=4572 RepID=M8ANU1_TRIUA|nr:hypothetical protein TRIUR3_19880 [Triticum urartu]